MEYAATIFAARVAKDAKAQRLDPYMENSNRQLQGIHGLRVGCGKSITHPAGELPL